MSKIDDLKKEIELLKTQNKNLERSHQSEASLYERRLGEIRQDFEKRFQDMRLHHSIDISRISAEKNRALDEAVMLASQVLSLEDKLRKKQEACDYWQTEAVKLDEQLKLRQSMLNEVLNQVEQVEAQLVDTAFANHPVENVVKEMVEMCKEVSVHGSKLVEAYQSHFSASGQSHLVVNVRDITMLCSIITQFKHLF